MIGIRSSAPVESHPSIDGALPLSPSLLPSPSLISQRAASSQARRKQRNFALGEKTQCMRLAATTAALYGPALFVGSTKAHSAAPPHDDRSSASPSRWDAKASWIGSSREAATSCRSLASQPPFQSASSTAALAATIAADSRSCGKTSSAIASSRAVPIRRAAMADEKALSSVPSVAAP